MLTILSIFLMSFSHAGLVGPHCEMKVVKVKNIQQETQNFGITNKGKILFRSSETKESGEDVSLLTIAQGLSANIQVQENLIVSLSNTVPVQWMRKLSSVDLKVTCKVVRFSGVEVDIALANVSGGPDNSTASSISTSVSITNGQRISLGGVVSDLNKKDKKIDIQTEATITMTEGEKQFEYWLESE